MQQQPAPSCRQTLTHSLPPALLRLLCQPDAELSRQSTTCFVCVCVCMRCGEGGKRTDSPAASGVDRWAESAPGQVVIPRMWGCLQGVLLEAEWPLNALRPHPRRASKKGWGLLSLKIPSSNHHSNPPSPILYDEWVHLREMAAYKHTCRNTLEWICSESANGPTSVLWRHAAFLSEYEWHCSKFPTELIRSQYGFSAEKQQQLMRRVPARPRSSSTMKTRVAFNSCHVMAALLPATWAV